MTADYLVHIPDDVFAQEIQTLEQKMVAEPASSECTLFYGSSTIRLWESLRQDFPELNLRNHAFGGSTLLDCLRAFPRLVTPVPLKQLVLYAGDNDLAQGQSAAKVLQTLEAFGAAMDQAHPGKPIYLFTVKPSPSRIHLLNEIRQTNEGIRLFAAKRPACHLVDPFPWMLDPSHRPNQAYFSDDWLHLNPTGYALWARLLRSSFELNGAMVG